jgi:two-component sensor histidine kinase
MDHRYTSGPDQAANESPHVGLGTSIVEALAHQLKATVEKSSGQEGTRVTITAAD